MACDAAQCSLQAVDCTLPALISHPTFSVYQRTCPPEYLGVFNRPSTVQSRRPRPYLVFKQEAGPEASGFRQRMQLFIYLLVVYLFIFK